MNVHGGAMRGALGVALVASALFLGSGPSRAASVDISADFEHYRQGHIDFEEPSRTLVNDSYSMPQTWPNGGAKSVSAVFDGTTWAQSAVDHTVVTVSGSWNSTEGHYYGWDYWVGTARASWADRWSLSAPDGAVLAAPATISVTWSLSGSRGVDGTTASLSVGPSNAGGPGLQRATITAGPADEVSGPDFANTRTDRFLVADGGFDIVLSVATSDPRITHAEAFGLGSGNRESWTARILAVSIPEGATLTALELPFRVTEVPEPATWATMAVGLWLMAALRRRGEGRHEPDLH